MSVHYKQPVLLIEFEEHKAFSLEVSAWADLIVTLLTRMSGIDRC